MAADFQDVFYTNHLFLKQLKQKTITQLFWHNNKYTVRNYTIHLFWCIAGRKKLENVNARNLTYGMSVFFAAQLSWFAHILLHLAYFWIKITLETLFWVFSSKLGKMIIEFQCNIVYFRQQWSICRSMQHKWMEIAFEDVLSSTTFIKCAGCQMAKARLMRIFIKFALFKNSYFGRLRRCCDPNHYKWIPKEKVRTFKIAYIETVAHFRLSFTYFFRFFIG